MSKNPSLVPDREPQPKSKIELESAEPLSELHKRERMGQRDTLPASISAHSPFQKKPETDPGPKPKPETNPEPEPKSETEP